MPHGHEIARQLAVTLTLQSATDPYGVERRMLDLPDVARQDGGQGSGPIMPG